MKFIDVISLGNGKYIKRYWNEFSGKKEIRKILIKYSDNKKANDFIEKDIFDLMVHYFSNIEDKIDSYKECFKLFIPIDKWDEATKFLSTYKNGLAEDFEKKQSGDKRYSSKCVHINGCNLCRIGRINIYQCNEYKE